tara:strand:+ start:2112 stop:2519 length:408 start_codon:yes stop_codon:yes gene_type:complete
MKHIVKQSIWSIFLNVFIGTLILGLIIGLYNFTNGETDFLSIFTIGILGTFIGLVSYGLFFLIPLLLLLLISSQIFVKTDSDILRVRRFLIIELVVLSGIFILLALVNKYYFGFAFVLILAISQYRRYIIIRNAT